MHRARWLQVVGFTTIAMGIALAWPLAPQWTVYLGGPQARLQASTALLGVAAITPLVAALLRRVEARRLVEHLHAAAETAAPAPRHVHPALRSVSHAATSAMERMRQRVQSAEQRARELELQLKIVTAERQHAQAILHSISDAVLVTDQFDEVVMANEAAARAFSFDLSTVQRAPLERVLRDTKMIQMIREMRQSDSRTGRRVVEHVMRTPAGQQSFKVTFSPVMNQASIAGVVAVLHDMTREHEVAKLKSDFVSNVSHELRTPLASIKAYVEMLVDGEAADDRTREEFYEVIQNEANRLGRLIDNILNVSRIESGLVKINKQPQSVLVLIKEALEVITPQAQQKSIRVVERLAPMMHQSVLDRDMMYQAILNLMSNAVKYTPDGGTMTVSADTDETRRIVTVRVQDTGVGIPAADLPFVFDKFYRVESNNRMAKGTGLGLPLVKHIVESVHEGRIFAQSTPGAGSTFGFELSICD